jgi:hypothetical protein
MWVTGETSTTISQEYSKFQHLTPIELSSSIPSDGECGFKSRPRTFTEFVRIEINAECLPHFSASKWPYLLHEQGDEYDHDPKTRSRNYRLDRHLLHCDPS